MYKYGSDKSERNQWEQYSEEENTIKYVINALAYQSAPHAQ